MITDWIFGPVLIVMGLATIRGKRGLASDAVRRIRFWMGREEDVDAYAFEYEVIGGLFILAGAAVLLWRLLA